jgi:hypothetical protein
VGGDGDIPNSGDYELSGRRTVQVILRNNPSPSQFAYLQNKEPGVDWFWYSSVIKVPDPIVNPPL